MSRTIIAALAAGLLLANPSMAQTRGPEQTASQTIAGMWVTADGQIRLELLPNGRYDEARGSRKSAYTGRYVVISDSELQFFDDSGFTARGQIGNGVMTVGPDRFRKE